MAKKKKRKQLQEQPKGDDVALTAEVAKHVFNWERLQNRCLTPISAYLKMAAAMPNATIIDGETDNPYIYLDYGAKVLGVAHLDTVAGSQHFANIIVRDEWWVLAAQLDDRLGVFLLLDVLRKLGMNYDVLLTTGEESSRSSAKKFVAPEGKEWNWMFECDRMDTDVVHYQYDDHQWLKAWREAGFNRIARGSYSDIASLDKLGICGMNMGVGYTDYHSVWAKANMSDCARQVMKLCRFYHANHDTKFAWEPPKVQSYTYPRGKGLEENGYEHWHRTNLPPLEDRTFSKDEEVLHVPTGERLTITSDWPNSIYHNKVRTRQWHTKLAKGTVTQYRAYPETELRKLELPPVQTKLLAAPQSEPETAVVPAAPATQRDIPDYEMGILHHSQRSLDNARELIVSHREICEGDNHRLNTRNYRNKYEEWLFGDELFLASGPFSVGAAQPFMYGDIVDTPEGRGTIDCGSPVVVKNEDYQYWVRLNTPDANGWHCHLIFESEITAVLAQNGFPLTVYSDLGQAIKENERVLAEVQAAVNGGGDD